MLGTDFGPEAEAIEDGALPYGDQELEYPPLSIPVIVGPALVGEGAEAYNEDFEIADAGRRPGDRAAAGAGAAGDRAGT